jgi:hypothetical protein
LLQDFVKVANLSGFDINPTEVLHEVLTAPHEPPRLPRGKQAVYVFSLAPPGGTVLKVGRVSSSSNTRFFSRHYEPHSCKYNLAKSLLQNPQTWWLLGIPPLDEYTVGDWLKTHTARDHFYLDARQSRLLLNLLEAFLLCRLRPLFEGQFRQRRSR